MRGVLIDCVGTIEDIIEAKRNGNSDCSFLTDFCYTPKRASRYTVYFGTHLPWTLLHRSFKTKLPDVAMALPILPPLQPPAPLPSFTSALITGSLPSSAALHLAISHLSGLETPKGVPKESTAIFTPSPDLYETTERGRRQGRGERLFVDEWIENHGLHGEYAHKLNRTHILYAITHSSIHSLIHSFIVLCIALSHSTVSTPRQLAAHLALWNCPVSAIPSKQTRDAVVNPSSTTFIILHNLSLLFPPSPPEANRNPFLRDVGQGGTLLSLVVQALAWGGARK